jgi:signal transduction histidine kinase
VPHGDAAVDGRRYRDAMQAIRALRTWFAAQPTWVADGLLALVLVAAHLPVLWAVEPGSAGFERFAGPTPLSISVTLATTLPIAWRRIRPGLVLAVVGLAMVAASAISMPGPGLALVVALYTYAAWTTRDDAALTLAVFGVFTVVALVLADAVRFAPLNLVVFATAWALGDRQRVERLRAEELQRRAAALERERASTVELATAHERTRIAQELHDVIAHGVTAMVTQATAAERLLDRDRVRAGAALQLAEDTGRASLAEVRRLLGLLRSAEVPAALRPQPGLRDVPELVGSFRDLGLEVDYVERGPVGTLRAGSAVGVSAYRIVEEGLANVAVHARARTVRVEVELVDGALRVAVLDDGVGPPPGDLEDRGTGLLGVTERVALLGGTLSRGPRPGGGYALEARLPLEPVGVRR